MMHTRFRWTIYGGFLSLFLCFISIILSGGGHGTQTPLLFFLPLGVIGVSFINDSIIVLLGLGVLQYIGYGLTIDLLKSRRFFAVAIVIITHLLLAAVAANLVKSTVY